MDTEPNELQEELPAAPAPAPDDGQAPGPDPEPAPAAEEVKPDPAQQAINKKHWQMMNERRAREAAEAETARIRAMLPQEQAPVIPDIPDPYDWTEAEYKAKMAERDTAVRKAADYDANRNNERRQQQANTQQRQQQEQQARQDKAEAYTAKAKALNIPPQELAAAGQTCVALDIGDTLADYILGDEQGPQVTVYLARNPSEIEKLRSMSPMSAAAYIATNIKPQAAKNSSAPGSLPPPPDGVSGGGAPPKEEGPPGARYE